MNNLVKTLAIAAFAAAGAFGVTTAQASASNFNVSFAVQNNDASNNMIVSGTIPSTVTGLSTSAISPGANNPASGHATYSDLLPIGLAKSVSLTFQAQNGGGACTFTLAVSKDNNPLGAYLLHFSSDAPSRCTAPADVHSSTGQFTSQTYILSWKSA